MTSIGKNQKQALNIIIYISYTSTQNKFQAVNSIQLAIKSKVADICQNSDELQ